MRKLLSVIAGSVIAGTALAACMIINTNPAIDSFEVGDIVHAWNTTACQNTWAFQYCSVAAPEKCSNYCATGSLADVYLSNVMEYKFSRIAPDRIIASNLWEGSSIEYGSTDIDVPLFLSRRMRNNNTVFGNAGNEYWYGGGVQITAETISNIWDVIEARTAYQRKDCCVARYSPSIENTYLRVTVADFTNNFEESTQSTNRVWKVVFTNDAKTIAKGNFTVTNKVDKSVSVLISDALGLTTKRIGFGKR